MVRWRLALFVLAALALSSPPADAAKPYRAERFDVRLDLASDGSMLVTEHVVFVFGPESFTTVYREIPVRRTDGVEVVGATMDGVPLDWGRNPGQAEVRRVENGRRRVTWHFAATADAAHAFGLTYRVRGVVVPDKGSDTFAWYVLPSGHDYPIGCSRVDVVPPAGFAGTYALEASPTATGQTGRWAGSGQASLERCDFARNQSWVAAVRFPPGTLAQQAPEWLQSEERARRWGPAFLAAGAAILLGGLMLIFFYWNNHRAAAPGVDRAAREPVPPSNLPVALAGALTRPAAQPAWGSLVGTLLDLARRGYVRLEETDKSWGQRQFAVVKLADPPGPAPHERVVMDLLFTTRKGARDRVKLSELRGAAPRAWKGFRRAVRDDLRGRGLVSAERERSASVLQRVGVAVVVVGVGGLALAAVFVSRFEGWPLAVPVSLMVLGVVTIGVGTSLSPLSDEGLRQAAHWKAFSRHLADARGGSGRAPDASHFADYLPYAMAFGAALSWAKALTKAGTSTVPDWVGHLGRGGDAGMADLVAVLSAAHGAGGQVQGHGAHAGVGGVGAAGGGTSGAH